MEVVWKTVPALILIFIAMPSFRLYYLIYKINITFKILDSEICILENLLWIFYGWGPR